MVANMHNSLYWLMMTTDVMLMTDSMLLTTVDVYVDAWYVNHMIKDVKINTHVMLWCYVMLHAMDRVFC